MFSFHPWVNRIFRNPSMLHLIVSLSFTKDLTSYVAKTPEKAWSGCVTPYAIIHLIVSADLTARTTGH